MEIQYAMPHPNIVEVIAFDLGDRGTPPCLVMELMDETLYDFLSTEGIILGLIDKVKIVRDVSEVCTIHKMIGCILLKHVCVQCVHIHG